MKNEEGFTLVEVMVALFIFVIMATAVFGAVQSINRTTSRAQLKDEIKEELHLTVESLKAFDLSDAPISLRTQLRKTNGAPEDRLSGYKSTAQIIESFDSRYNKTIGEFSYEIRTSKNDIDANTSGMTKVSVSKGGLTYEAYVWLNTAK